MVLWLGLGYLILLMFYGVIENLSYYVGLSTATWIFERFNSIQLKKTWRIRKPCPEWDGIYVWRTQCSVSFSNGSQYPLYYPRYISGYEEVRITTTKQTSMMETELLTRPSLSSGPLVTCVRENLSQPFISCGRKIFFQQYLQLLVLIENTLQVLERTSWRLS